MGAVRFALMSRIQKRNCEIVRLSQEGVAHRDIADKFRSSRSRIDAIVHRCDADKVRAERSATLLSAIRQIDRLEARWPAADLMAAILLLPVTLSAFRRHFEALEADSIGLLELMDRCLGSPLKARGYWSKSTIRTLLLAPRFL